MTREDRRHWAAVGLITLVAAVLRLTDLDRFSFWIDEIITVCSADAIQDMRTLFTPSCGNMHPPLYFLLVKIWSWAGRDDGWLRLLPALFGVVTVPVVYLLARELAGKSAGLVACALAAVSPFLLLHDRELRMYSLLTLLSTGSLLYFLRALRHERHADWAVFTVLSILNLYTHYHAVLVLFGQALLLLLWVRRLQQWRPVLVSAVVIAVAFGFWMPQFVYQVQHPAAFALDAPDKFPVISGAGAARLGYALFAMGVGQTVLPWRPIAVLGMVVIGALGAMGLWYARRHPRMPAVVMACGAAPLLLGFAVSQSMPRYYIFVTPIFFTVVAVGWLAVRKAWARSALASALLLVAGFGVTNYFRGRDFHILATVDPWREVGAHLTEHAQPGDCLLPLGSYLPLKYYTNGLAPFQNAVVSDVATAAACIEAGPSHRMWLVAGEGSMAARAAEAVRAFDSRYDRVGERMFLYDPDASVKARWFRKSFLEYRVSIYLYQLRTPQAANLRR